MKTHYFDQTEADKDDMQLGMAKMQGYIPQGCLLGGITVMAEIQTSKDPCAGCNGPRNKCGGRNQNESNKRPNK